MILRIMQKLNVQLKALEEEVQQKDVEIGRLLAESQSFQSQLHEKVTNC